MPTLVEHLGWYQVLFKVLITMCYWVIQKLPEVGTVALCPW